MKSNPEDPVPVSALEHYSYCPRQCALIHVERVWDENIYTIRGHYVHERVDAESSNEISGVLQARALPIWSKRLGLVGKADLVEFYDNIPYPVEYKSGHRRAGRHETVQLCAQALCLEEMFGVPVEKGAIYWHGSRKRRELILTDAMRDEVRQIASAVHELLEGCRIPPPANDQRCRDCSLKESCLPHVVGDKNRNQKAELDLFLLENSFDQAESENQPEEKG